MLKVHDTRAHGGGNAQLIGRLVSRFASDHRGVKVILSGRRVHSSTPPAPQLLPPFGSTRGGGGADVHAVAFQNPQTSPQLRGLFNYLES